MKKGSLVLFGSMVYGSLLLINQMFRILATGLAFHGETIISLPYTGSVLLLGTFNDLPYGPGQVAAVALLVILPSVLAWRIIVYSPKGVRFSLPASLLDTILAGSVITLAWTSVICVFQPYWINLQIANIVRGTPITNLLVLQVSLLTAPTLASTRAAISSSSHRNELIFITMILITVLAVAVPLLTSSTLGQYTISGGY